MIIKKSSDTHYKILNDLISHTDFNCGCLEWRGCLNTDGYPRMVYKGNANVKVHRLVAGLSCDFDITGKVVRHTCDNPKCINPSHLLLGSPIDNVKDRDNRGRTFRIITPDIVKAVKELNKGEFSQKQISKLIGIDPRRVSDILNNRYNDEAKLIRR